MPHGRGAVGLDVSLVYGGGVELPLHYQVGLLEPLGRVADLEDEMVGDVAALTGVVIVQQAPSPAAGRGHGHEAVVEQGGVLFHGVQHAHHGWEHLVVHVDQ